MSTLTRRSSGTKITDYKDYMNFVSAYRNGKSEAENHQEARPVLENNNQKNGSDTAGKRPLQIKPSCDSYSSFLEKSKNKKFESVKPPIPSRDTVDSLNKPMKKPVKVKTEVFLEINDDSKQVVNKNSWETKEENKAEKQVQKTQLCRTLSREVENKRKLFENNSRNPTVVQETVKKFSTISVKIDKNGYLDDQTKETPCEISKSESTKQTSDLIDTFEAKVNKVESLAKTNNSFSLNSANEEKFNSVKKLREELSINLGGNGKDPLRVIEITTKEELALMKFPENSSIITEIEVCRKSPELKVNNEENSSTCAPPPPPPPPMPSLSNGMQIKIPQVAQTSPNKNSVNKGSHPTVMKASPKTVVANGHLLPKVDNEDNSTKSQKHSTLDRKDPLVRKLAYGAMLDMYGAYHDKANSYVATLPKNYVRKGNGLQKIIDDIAAQGGLDKLSGRSNPKTEME